jgi:hypothetical protein
MHLNNRIFKYYLCALHKQRLSIFFVKGGNVYCNLTAECLSVIYVYFINNDNPFFCKRRKCLLQLNSRMFNYYLCVFHK